jgi:hypothetical protein
MIRPLSCHLLETPAIQFQRALDRAVNRHCETSKQIQWGEPSDSRCLEAVTRAFYDLIDLGIEARTMGNGRGKVFPELVTGSGRDFFVWRRVVHDLSSDLYFNRPNFRAK